MERRMRGARPAHEVRPGKMSIRYDEAEKDLGSVAPGHLAGRVLAAIEKTPSLARPSRGLPWR